MDEEDPDHGVDGGRRHPCTESPTLLALAAGGLGAAILPEPALASRDTTGVTVHSAAVEVGARVLTLTGPRTEDRSPSVERVHQVLRETANR